MCNEKLPEQSLAWVRDSASITLPRDYFQAGNMVGMSQRLLPVHIWMLFARRLYQQRCVLEQRTLCPAAGLGDSRAAGRVG